VSERLKPVEREVVRIAGHVEQVIRMQQPAGIVGAPRSAARASPTSK